MLMTFFLTAIAAITGTYDMREDAKSLGKLQDRLNTPCVKLGKPAPKFVELIKKNPQISNRR